MYCYFGSPVVLENQYSSMLRWVEHMEHDGSTRASPSKDELAGLVKNFMEAVRLYEPPFFALTKPYQEPDPALRLGDAEIYP
jgi:hypothetical protein